MSQVWFTADTHFGHSNIIKYCKRPFLSDAELEQLESDPRGRWRVSPDTVERHDTALLEAINSRLSKHDTLWVLGDFCWGDEKEAKGYLDRINCKNVNFVWGNHDHRSIGRLFKKTIEQEKYRSKGKRFGSTIIRCEVGTDVSMEHGNFTVTFTIDWRLKIERI